MAAGTQITVLIFLSLWGFSISQYGHYGPPYEYEQRNKVYYKLKKDPIQSKPSKPSITRDNLFGWLNKKNYVKFYLWTRKNPDLAHELKYNDVESIKRSNWDPNKLTKIIIHGWADGASEVQIGDWLIFMRDSYLGFADVNFVVVDYAVYASFFLYFTARPALVATRVAEWIGFMEKQGLELDPLHVVGWSWGAHVAGMAGHKLNGRIGRITGIDPAGPTFKYISNEHRLDKSDAQFVDIIHVNGGYPSSWGFFGLPEPLGHLDFYPSGSEAGRQIGCPQGQTLIYESLWCSHGRGVKYWTESIFSPLAFKACRCDTFDMYIKGSCLCSLEDTAYMGDHLSVYSARGVYQLFTKPKPLYGHGVPLNLTLPNLILQEKEENRMKMSGPSSGVNESIRLNDIVPHGAIRIQHKDVATIVEFKDTYHSKAYPNDDILNLCMAFVANSTSIGI